jgi:hypothetical protein
MVVTQESQVSSQELYYQLGDQQPSVELTPNIDTNYNPHLTLTQWTDVDAVDNEEEPKPQDSSVEQLFHIWTDQSNDV